MRRLEEPGYETIVTFHASASAKADERLPIFIDPSAIGASLAKRGQVMELA